MAQLTNVVDRINAMRSQEEKKYNRISDYLNMAPKSEHMINKLCRTTVCEWFYDFVDSTMLQRETAISAMNILDRFLSSENLRSQRTISSRKEYQLAAMTSLFISIKLFESCDIDTAILANLSRKFYNKEAFVQYYTKEDFRKMERDIVVSLDWNLNCPTAIAFLEYFMSAIPHSNGNETYDYKSILKTYSKYLVERSVEDYEISINKPSNIALAAMSVGMKKFSEIQDLEKDKDFLKLVCSIKTCSHFDLDGKHIGHVVNQILQLPIKQIKLRILNDSDNGFTPKASSQSALLQSNLDNNNIMLTEGCPLAPSSSLDFLSSPEILSSVKTEREQNDSPTKIYPLTLPAILLHHFTLNCNSPGVSTNQKEIEENNKAVHNDITNITAHKLIKGRCYLEVKWKNGETSWEERKSLELNFPSMTASYLSSPNKIRNFHRIKRRRMKKAQSTSTYKYLTPPKVATSLQTRNDEAPTQRKKSLTRLSLQNITFPILDNGK